MGPNVAWILRPGGVSLVGALAFACLVLPGGVARGASNAPIATPDLPPSGAVVVPTPDSPVPHAPAPVVGRAPTVVRAPTVLRPALRTKPAAAAHPAERAWTKPATPARSHPEAASRSASKSKPSAASAVLRRAVLPDSVGAFLSIPLPQAVDDGRDRGALALAGMLLAIVTLGGGFLTVAVGRLAKET